MYIILTTLYGLQASRDEKVCTTIVHCMILEEVYNPYTMLLLRMSLEFQVAKRHGYDF